jgi:hypothetical protein
MYIKATKHLKREIKTEKIEYCSGLEHVID